MPVVNKRGAGLGNELVAWARVIVAASILNAKPLHPAFGLNPRKYWKHFNTSRFDWFIHRVMREALPHYSFTENDFHLGSGSLQQAVRLHAEKHGLYQKKIWIWSTQGMWGGYRHIKEVKEYIKALLYSSRYAMSNLIKFKNIIDNKKVTVALHIRLDDFNIATHESEYKGVFNRALPLEWYYCIMNSLRDKLGSNNVQFVIVSDGKKEQLSPLINDFTAITTFGFSNSDISDLLILSEADLLVCSVSSYSLWGAFLSSSPYLWFEANLYNSDGYFSIWGHESSQKKQFDFTNMSKKEISEFDPADLHCRGIPVGINGYIPDQLIDDVMRSFRLKSIYSDLVCHGVVPVNGD